MAVSRALLFKRPPQWVGPTRVPEASLHLYRNSLTAYWVALFRVDPLDYSCAGGRLCDNGHCKYLPGRFWLFDERISSICKLRLCCAIILLVLLQALPIITASH